MRRAPRSIPLIPSRAVTQVPKFFTQIRAEWVVGYGVALGWPPTSPVSS